MPDVRGLRWFCPSSCGAYHILLFLGMLLFLTAALADRCFMASPTSCDLQCNPGFTCTMYAIVSQDVHVGTSLPHAWPQELFSMVNKERFCNAFTHASFMTLKPELHGWCRQVWLLTTWDVARRFNLLLLFRSWKFLSSVHFTSWNIAMWGLSLRVPFPLSHWTSDLSWNFSSFFTDYASNITFPGAVFSSNCMFYISFDPLPVFYKICIRVVTNNHWTELKTGCLELSSVKVIRANI